MTGGPPNGAGGRGPAPPEAPGPAPSRPPWYRRRAVLVALGVVLVAAVTVLSDLPVHSSRASDIANERAVMSEVNGDLSSCAYAVHESFTIWGEAQHHQLTPADLHAAPSLLRDDQAACSFTNESMFDLSNIEVPGSAAGRRMGSLVGTATLWATSDALGAVEDLEDLMSDPHDQAAAANLATRERQLAADRASSEQDVAAADRILNTRLAQPDMPALPGG